MIGTIATSRLCSYYKIKAQNSVVLVIQEYKNMVCISVYTEVHIYCVWKQREETGKDGCVQGARGQG